MISDDDDAEQNDLQPRDVRLEELVEWCRICF